MVAVVLILTWACAIGIMTTASRMTWSFARDRGTPFSSIISYVSRKRRIPVVGVAVVTTFAALLTLIYIGSSTAFNDVISLTITGFYCSYFLPAAFLLWHRIKGHIDPYKKDTPGVPIGEDSIVVTEGEAAPDPYSEKKAPLSSDDSPTEQPTLPNFQTPGDRRPSLIAQAPLQWGPFHLPGILGIINNAYACTYMIFVIFWSVWPPVTPVDAETMNYSVVVTGGVVIFSIVWYWIRGRKEYHGPTIDEEVKAVMRIGSIVAA